MSEEISNKTLLVIIIAAIVITLGSTALIMRIGTPFIPSLKNDTEILISIAKDTSMIRENQVKLENNQDELLIKIQKLTIENERQSKTINTLDSKVTDSETRNKWISRLAYVHTFVILIISILYSLYLNKNLSHREKKLIHLIKINKSSIRLFLFAYILTAAYIIFLK